MNSLIEKVKHTIVARGMLTGGETVLVGVSGGPDSLALLSVLDQLRGDYHLDLHVFHLNHLMRGAAQDDADFVSRTAAEMGLPVTVLTADVPAYIKANKVSPEDGARQVRRELMAQVAEEVGAGKIALGHNADDRAETFLMRVIRGAGLDGLRSIPPVNGPIIRPLIDSDRAGIEAYCADAGLKPRQDETNLSAGAARNKVRLELLPLLEREYNPNLRAELRREIESIGDDTALLNALADAAFEAVAAMEEGAVRLERDALAGLPLALRRRVLRLAAAELAGDPQPLGFAHVADILDKVVAGSSGAALDLPGGLSAEREYDTILIRVSADEPAQKGLVDAETVLSVPGLTAVAGTGWSLEASWEDGAAIDKTAGPNLARLDWAAMSAPVTVRLNRPGDSFHPLGAGGRKKLSDLFIDAKAPRGQRKVPVVETAGQIAWVAGWQIDERFKIKDSTTKILVLKLAGEAVARGNL